MKQKKNGLLRTKLAALRKDDRSFRSKLLYSGIAVFAACFLFIFYGPFEVVAYSGTSLAYSHTDIAPLLIITTFVATLILAPLFALLKGRFYDVIITLTSAFTLAGYIQSLFFNSALTSLTGDAVNWTTHSLNMFLSLFVWVFIISLGFFLLYLGRHIWKGAVIFVAFASFVMASTATASIFITGSDENANYATFSTTGMYEYSENDNTFVFVLDRLDYKYIEDVLEDDPSFFEKFDGFTQYTNAVSTFSRTKPAINHMLTGSDELAYTVTLDEFRKKSWTLGGKNLLSDIKSQGYDINIYAQFQDLYLDMDYAKEYISNVETERFEVNALPMLAKMLHLSFYRHAPTALKPFFETDTNFYNEGVLKTDTSYSFKDSAYAPGFKTSTATKSENNFKFYHFNGSHAPYFMNSDGTSGVIPTSAKIFSSIAPVAATSSISARLVSSPRISISHWIN